MTLMRVLRSVEAAGVTAVLALVAGALPYRDITASQTESTRAVLAVVTDPRNRAMIDLDPDEFVISESGTRRDVLSVHLADYPVALLLDNGVPSADFKAIKSAAARFVGRIGQRAVAIGTLTDPPATSAPQHERSDVLSLIDKLTEQPGAAPRPASAIAAAVQAVTADEPPFAAVVVVSGRAGFDDDGRDLLTPLADRRIVVHAVAHRPAEAARSGLIEPLRTVTERTRGLYTQVYSPASYSAALDRVGDRLSIELMVEYLTPAAGPMPPQAVQIGISIPGARINGLGVSK